ncbi:Gfo/Idh/MocA family protein [Paenibacillus sp. UASWS1643]|uniref:Gfo/Idh/MocA family protein n=1 Tax=Paenibacillus sp. UASWS1643 TaxID=2580422 RepID=UPI00123C61B4|nr:Gfo/Idh/MocA family oxidoreductase [Paenibacillus sp. UASWS1643]KAA8746137.1 Gfo/Idh/MocA family oxidoreductase [Paenibacillus sp. UASWS1643]
MNHPRKGIYRLGILGCASIVSKAILDASLYVPQVQLAAIANRTRSKALQLAEKYSIPRVMDHLQDLLDDQDIDAVYIALSNDLHTEWAIKALEAGKHVLVEKPAGLNATDARQLANAMSNHGCLVFMEGIMTAHHPWQSSLKAIADSGQFGRLYKTETRISIPSRHKHMGNYRSVKSKGGGCFNDLGCYWLQWIQQLIGLEACKVTGASDYAGPDGCDWTFSAGLRYASGLESECITSFEMPYKATHTLYFEQASVIVPDFFRPINGFYKMKIRLLNSKTNSVLHEFAPMNYYVNQLATFINKCDSAVTSHVDFQQSIQRIAWHRAIMNEAELFARKQTSQGGQTQ